MTKFKIRPLLSLLLALLMVVTMLPVSALAAEPEDDTISGTVGDSAVVWTYDACCGRLTITGEGGCETFASKDDQPWAAFRTEIREVWFNGMDTLTIENLAYWFDGCTSLASAELPYTTIIIGERAFANCPALTAVMFYYPDEAKVQIAPGAFAVSETTDTTLYLIAAYQRITLRIFLYDWASDNRNVDVQDVYGIMLLAGCGLGSCTCTSCSWYYKHESAGKNGHDSWICCSGCDTVFWLNTFAHSYSSNGYCTDCGYYNSAYDQTPVCNHNSTYKPWSGCDWTEYCSDCGEYIGSGTSHGSTYTTWSGCNWYEYCRDCGQLMDSGASHSYSYGGWEYYNSSRHQRTGACTSCGATLYSYGYHSTSTQYSPYSSTQHSYGRYCSVCSSYVGSVSYANHSFSYGNWQSCSEMQHRRTVSCSTCGYSDYEYEHHALTNGAWTSISDTQHQRTNTCSCGYSKTETGAHTDTDNDGCCDDCEYLMARFSVIVPSSLTMTVSEHGEVYAANTASIINNSSGAVEVTAVTVTTANGWRLVPYSTSMANAKVDTKLLGFSLNGAATSQTGAAETLALSGDWTIASGASLPLTYDAVVSAMSQPVNEQVLTVVFVLNWAVS